MDQCANADCKCSETGYDRAGSKFCSIGCADATEQKSLADAMCACAHEPCGEEAHAGGSPHSLS